MTDCVFCPDNWDNLDIVSRHTMSTGEYAIVNPLDPVTMGHVLVISAEHTSNAAHKPYQVSGPLFAIACDYADRFIDQANIITSIGPDATQTVMHTHVHVVPRRPNDGLPLPWTPQHELKRLHAIQALRQVQKESSFDNYSMGIFQQQPTSWPEVADKLAEGLTYGDD
jgi:histidine triad (HIT) family protein